MSNRSRRYKNRPQPIPHHFRREHNPENKPLFNEEGELVIPATNRDVSYTSSEIKRLNPFARLIELYSSLLRKVHEGK